MKIKLFTGELEKMTQDFNEWAKEDIEILDFQIACSLASIAVPGRPPALGGVLSPQVGLSIANAQIFILAVLYEELEPV